MSNKKKLKKVLKRMEKDLAKLKKQERKEDARLKEVIEQFMYVTNGATARNKSNT